MQEMYTCLELCMSRIVFIVVVFSCLLLAKKQKKCTDVVNTATSDEHTW